jgi:ppGpp synthetase/RelA/SpoT-type nucleotidyltranferase
MRNFQHNYKSLLRILEQEYGSPLPQRAKFMLKEAIEGSKGQFRSAPSGKIELPAIVHPVGTAKFTIRYYAKEKTLSDDLETIICVALAHDLIEDISIDPYRLEAIAGAKVRKYVEDLTKPPAGIVGKDREQRNRDFLKQIINSGPSAIFVKICDNMHNLSYPSSTPLHILDKIIEKAERYYYPLAEEYLSGSDLKANYAELISEAKNFFRGQTAHERLKYGYDLKTAIVECINRSSGKVLELHDVVDILTKITKAPFITIWFCQKNKLHPVTKTKKIELVQKSNINLQEKATYLGSRTKIKEITSSKNISELFLIPMRTDSGRIFYVGVGFNKTNKRPKWLSLEALTMIVQFLTHRLIIAETERRSFLASIAARSGIQLDSKLAAQIGVKPAELNELESWRSYCQQAIAIVVHYINLSLMTKREEVPLRNLIRIEFRVKTVDSILQKMNRLERLSWPNFGCLEDIAGVRVVCPTLSGMKSIENILLSAEAKKNGIRLNTRIRKPYRDYRKNPTAKGYRGLHLVLEVDTHLGGGQIKTVPCEAQIRTMFQDTWAVLSHETGYNLAKDNEHRNRELMTISKILQKCENLAEKLTTKRDKIVN